MSERDATVDNVRRKFVAGVVASPFLPACMASSVRETEIASARRIFAARFLDSSGSLLLTEWEAPSRYFFRHFTSGGRELSNVGAESCAGASTRELVRAGPAHILLTGCGTPYAAAVSTALFVTIAWPILFCWLLMEQRVTRRFVALAGIVALGAGAFVLV